MTKIGFKIKRLREKRGWTQAELGRRAGLHKVSVAQNEIGRRKNPTLVSLKKLGKALGVEITELLD